MNASMSTSLPSGMYWQVFRKDWRLLKPLVIANAALQGLQAVASFHREPFPLSDERSALAMLVTLALSVTMCLLIVLVVQQDAIPGVNQDWKVRPIKRHELLVAKLLSVALLIHGPIVAANLVTGIAEGFPVGQLVGVTLLANLEIAMLFSLPAMTIAALTRSVGEALIGSLAVAVGLLLVRLTIPVIYLPLTHQYHFSGPVAGTGVEWLWRFVSHLVLLATSLAALSLQYFRRDTARARVLFVAGLLSFMLAQALPWKPAFAIQRQFAQTGLGHDVTVAFDPAKTPAVVTDGGSGQLLQEEGDSSESQDKGSTRFTRVVLPLQVSGLSSGLVLHVDRCAVRIIAIDPRGAPGGRAGRTLYRGEGQLLDVRSQSDGSTALRQAIGITTSVYRTVADQRVRVELEYSLTLFRSRTLPPLRAPDDHRRLAELGRCATRMNAAGTAVEVGCRQAGEQPFCISLSLEHDGRRNPETFVCDLNYEPAILRFGLEPLDHLHSKLPFRDPAGLAHYPVDYSQLHDARVALAVYDPVDHLSRRVSIPSLRLSDWTAVGRASR